MIHRFDLIVRTPCIFSNVSPSFAHALCKQPSISSLFEFLQSLGEIGEGDDSRAFLRVFRATAKAARGGVGTAAAASVSVSQLARLFADVCEGTSWLTQRGR